MARLAPAALLIEVLGTVALTLLPSPAVTLPAPLAVPLPVPVPVPAMLAAESEGPGPGAEAPSHPGGAVVSIENGHARLVVGTDGRALRLIDLGTERDVRDGGAGASPPPWARVRAGAVEHGASAVAAIRAVPADSPDGPADEGREEAAASADILVTFGPSVATARLRWTAAPGYFVLEVLSLEGADVESFTFIDLPLGLEGKPGEPLACTALALNLRTNVREIPQPARLLRAMCYPKLGFAGARVALVACPPEMMRDVLKAAVSASPDLPRSTLGGPWALDAEVNRGSYLFNFGGLSEATVDAWIAVARSLGFSQIDFHGGGSFRFGDCRPDPGTYPEGFESLKAVIDRLHAAGISAGLHTYAFFIDKRCPWVTPVPDPRLGSDRTLTLAAPLSPEDTTVAVLEETKGMSATTGFFVRNSATLMVGDELIVYGGVEESPPSFTGCLRGAHGTNAGAHPAGATVRHLVECFGLFAPDGDSTLLEEVAASTAEAFNRCGFDMIYMDALDGEDVLGGAEWGWHYGAKFVHEVARRLDRPAVMEMSTFHHHLWCVRSRMGAWDHPTRSHKRFIDIHCAANEGLRRMFLPGQLGWWAVKTWSGHQGEPTFSDDIEYLCAKALGNDTGLSLMGIDPRTIVEVPAYARLAEIFRGFEGLRRSGAIGEGIRASLREPGKEFALEAAPDGSPILRPVQYARHRVEGIDGWSDTWTVENPFGEGPAGIRIEALYSAGPYGTDGGTESDAEGDAGGNAKGDAGRSIVVAGFEEPGEFAGRGAAEGVVMRLTPASAASAALQSSAPGGPRTAGRYGILEASSSRSERRGSWAHATKELAPPLDLSRHQALGVWLRGDGKGETINIQLRCPEHIVAGLGEHYVVVDFEGWRYFELIEPEGERYERYSWPYGNPYAIYRENVDYAHVSSLGLWVNDLPPGEQVSCLLGPIRALPLVAVKLRNPSVTIEGKTVVFPVEIETGSYMELRPAGEARLYGPTGGLVGTVKQEGDIPALRPGANRVRFHAEGPEGASVRARVTVISMGQPLTEG